jgi:mRNA interferase MazF
VTLPARREVWWCDHPDIGRRPVVVLSRDEVIARRRLAVVAPCTTTIRGLHSEVRLTVGDDPIVRDCVVNADAIESVPIALLVERIGRLSDGRMRELCAATSVALGCTWLIARIG